jgi:RNA polymerase sporulation-specific sigma factor
MKNGSNGKRHSASGKRAPIQMGIALPAREGNHLRRGQDVAPPRSRNGNGNGKDAHGNSQPVPAVALARMVDEDLVRLAQNGDVHAYEHLLNKFKQMVLQQTRPYYLAGADTEDLIQEGMIGLFKAIRDFSARKSNSFPAFATLCIRRQILSAVKMANRLKYAPLNSAHSLDQSPTEDTDVPLADMLIEPSERGAEEVWMDKVTTRHLRVQMRRMLSPLEYQSIIMYASGMTYHEIADELGRTSECIDRALFRGKRKIKRIIAEEHGNG